MLIMYYYMICCKPKLMYMEIINYKCIKHTYYEIDMYLKISLNFIFKLKCNIYMHKKIRLT